MKNDLLKALALKAKNRLIHKDDQAQNDARIKIIKSTDQDFYEKVKAILEKDMDTTSPIKELMDQNIMATMTSAEREKYLFQTIDKYQKVRLSIQDEKELKVVY